MFHSRLAAPERLIDRLRSRFGERAAGFALALLVELLLALMLLTLAKPVFEQKKNEQVPMSVFSLPDAQKDVTPGNASKKQPTPDQKEPARQKRAQTSPTPSSQPAQQPSQPKPEPAPEKQAPALINIAPNQMADISNIPHAASAPAASAPSYGPVAPAGYTGPSSDSQRVGTTASGQPLYAARWQREPTHEELSGFLSAAKDFGWGMINCRTAPNFRVEDCQIVDEYPEHSGIARAVQLAAYQFRVVPPRVGGMPQVGDWVRIMITYSDGRLAFKDRR